MTESPDGLARFRGILRRFTTPLLPDDYTVLANPLWSKRELRGKIESVERFPDDTIHLVIRPGWGVPSPSRPASTSALACASTAATPGAPTP